LFLISNGGSIEAAYKITKLCKQYSESTYEVIIPRHAKSAATLIAIGADVIHIGPLGELGPIDPQVGGLPALGVKRALEIIAPIVAKNPKSSELFARYLGSKLSIEQIGYCDRVSESAVQYA
jgi:ClpP class serine protease